MIKRLFFFTFLILFSSYGIAQEDLLDELESQESNDTIPVQSVFKALQVVTSQSTKLAGKKDLYFIVSHRFGSIADGFEEFFGLDNATTRIGFIYGLTDYASLSISRHTYQKTWEFGAKYSLFKQQKGKFPVSLVGYNVLGLRTDLDDNVFTRLEFEDQLHYTNQLLISRKISPSVSVQLTPSYIHKNLINDGDENKNQFSIGTSGRVKLSNALSLNAEFFYNFDKPGLYKHPLSLGLDIETGGHVFQLILSNSQPMTEAGYITNALGDWGEGEIFFGFNLYRVF